MFCFYNLTFGILFLVESLDADLTAPGSFRSDLHRRHQAVHVVSSVAVVTEKQLVIVLRGAAQGASLALDALPRILPHADQHVSRELQTCWMAY